MIFKKIRMENFRQYKGLMEFDFSFDQDKTISLFIAENGVGKTTFIQAFRFCFYGNLKNNKYLKLPKPNDLINNTVIYDLEDGEIAPVMVEVTFEHNGTNYIMNRTFEYIKHGNRMGAYTENSTLSYATGSSGYRTFNTYESNIEMNKILPAGLSHIFMFDGERMEKEISSREFKDELKESILGILNIKKYDSLINHLGETNLSTSVIGRLFNQISHSSIDEKIETEKYNQYKEKLDIYKNEFEQIKKEISNTENEINKLKDIQEELAANQQKIREISTIEFQIEKLESDKSNLANEIGKKGFSLLKYKLLMDNRSKFDQAAKEAMKTENFYQFVHIDTLNEILERKKCICGTVVEPNSTEEYIIRELKLSALPDAHAQYISFIESDIYSKTKNYQREVEYLRKYKKELDNVNAQLQELKGEERALREDIDNVEKQFGKNEQENIDSLHDKLFTLASEKKECEINITNFERLINNQEKTLRPMWDANQKNNNVTRAIEELRNIKERLLYEKLEKEEVARKTLSKFFNKEIELVMSGEYETRINEDYSINIIDRSKNIDVTEVLSTGQHVIISVSFIKSLISTAKELSEQYSGQSKYGVIMDAALSNLDESHIRNISEYNLVELDQLIFLSFKRQLRDEMFHNIKDKIGVAYSLEKEGNGIKSTQLNYEDLEDYIHFYEEDNNE